MKETCHIHTFWALTAHKELFRPPVPFPGGQWFFFSKREVALRQMGKACARAVWAGFYPRVALQFLLTHRQEDPNSLSFSRLTSLSIPPKAQGGSCSQGTSGPGNLPRSCTGSVRKGELPVCTSVLLPTLGRISFAHCCWKLAEMHKSELSQSSQWDSLYSVCVSLEALEILSLWQNLKGVLLKAGS